MIIRITYVSSSYCKVFGKDESELIGNTFFPLIYEEKEYPGTGAGLAVAQRIIHRHGGEIRAEGEVGKGA